MFAAKARKNGNIFEHENVPLLRNVQTRSKKEPSTVLLLCHHWYCEPSNSINQCKGFTQNNSYNWHVLALMDKYVKLVVI